MDAWFNDGDDEDKDVYGDGNEDPTSIFEPPQPVQWKRVHGNNFGRRIEDYDMDERMRMRIIRMRTISLTIKSILPQLVEEGAWQQFWPHD